ncbi:antibiotic biosynthesis monooxygenase [Arthrobacter sp. MYb213]|uniref:antibiotic biosynthesis monooxygenase family protein n=1 Tax=Arthrobacter sp. MYb213 TaxID=1848595 RepID=UPI000CFC1C3B|nr:antibiotic biosynthesis monooxygenase [Arthrobacter sp. MYb213]PRB67442.1 antibiotic biosynthesis monooxygenase [Arthrobacter sp. MYb213]
MIVEHAILPVRSGAEEAFELAFGQARSLIEEQPGFIALQLSRSIQSPNQYLLLVRWESVAAHTEGFRRSAQYQLWKQALHHFYDPFPVVEHFTPVFDSEPGSRAEDGL